MIIRPTELSFLILALVLSAPPSLADQTFLFADFNDKAIDQPIGEGGPEVGEPVEVYTTTISAIVRQEPMGSPSLEIRDISSFGAGFVVFELLDGAELTSGTVSVSADFWFQNQTSSSRFLFQIRERGSTEMKFADLRFNPTSSVDLVDAQGYAGIIGHYETDRRYRVVLEYDMDAGTYDVWLDGERALNDRAHGVAERGIGWVIFGCFDDDDQEGLFNIDAVSVTDYFQEVPVLESSWGRIKASFRR
jgi:hypothetical protein